MTKTQFWIANVVGVACLVTLAAQLTLVSLNRGLRADIDMRQQYVQQSLQLEGLYREIVRALAELGARNNDEQVRGLLQQHGITYTVNPPAAAPAPARK
jgi:hypothetical protein